MKARAWPLVYAWFGTLALLYWCVAQGCIGSIGGGQADGGGVSGEKPPLVSDAGAIDVGSVDTGQGEKLTSESLGQEPPNSAEPAVDSGQDSGPIDAQEPSVPEVLAETPMEMPLPEGPFSCADLGAVPTSIQISIIENDLSCLSTFMRLLDKQPRRHLDALYALVVSHKTTEKLFLAIYEGLRRRTFVFDGPIVDLLYKDLRAAVARCQGHARCAEWKAHVVAALERGDLYRCPALSSLTKAQLLQSVPYGNYDCTARTVGVLAPKFDTQVLSSLFSILKGHQMPWARRNVLRILGRTMERPKGDPAREMLRVTKAADVQKAAMERLQVERELVVINDAIWLLDVFYFPHFPAKDALLKAAGNKSLHESGRFRAITAYARLIKASKTPLTSADVKGIIDALQSDNTWVRAQAAFIIETIRAALLTAASKQALLQAVNQAWSKETSLLPKAYMARVLDKYQGTSHLASVKQNYESKHIPNSAQSQDKTLRVRSSSSVAKLQSHISLMEKLRTAFFQFMGASFKTPVAGDTNASMTLVVFASKQHYQDYLNAFEGGARGGGIYIEKIATLYTYERASGTSQYTVEDLIKHEFMHYLQGRFVYPDQWLDPGYHAQPRGWADEGFAELFAGIKLGQNGQFSWPLREVSLRQICGLPYRNAADLIAQTAGYNKDGVFDYPFAWAWVYFLFTKHKTSAIKVFQSFRNKSYTLNQFATLMGQSVSSLNTSWHQSIKSWCKSLKLPVSLDGGHDHTHHWHQPRHQRSNGLQ